MNTASALEDVLEFWFGVAPDNATVAQQQGKLWWSKSEDCDRQIRARFEPVLRALADFRSDRCPGTPRERLARIIVLDQFSRNMYRGTPAAFATDPVAQQWAISALATGDEGRLRPIERVFLYMPLEHAEDRALQAVSVERFESLRDQAGEDDRRLFDDYLDFAVRHRDIIERFGRFPHRNAILGRPSTPAEIEFLKKPGSSF